jgi:hypothetical protein
MNFREDLGKRAGGHARIAVVRIKPDNRRDVLDAKAGSVLICLFILRDALLPHPEEPAVALRAKAWCLEGY